MVYEVAFCTGLRANELRSLTINHLDHECCCLRLDAAWAKARKEVFQPLARWLMDRLKSFAETGKAQELYRDFHERFYRAGKPLNVPTNPLLYVPSHPSRDLGKDMKAAGVPKWAPGGKVDFHALRVAYSTFVVEAGANVKEAQTLARHTDPRITMNVYTRTRSDRLGVLAETVSNTIKTQSVVAVQRTGTDGSIVNDGVNNDGAVPAAETAAGTALLRHQPRTGMAAVSTTSILGRGLSASEINGGGGNRTRVPRYFQ